MFSFLTIAVIHRDTATLCGIILGQHTPVVNLLAWSRKDRISFLFEISSSDLKF